MTDITCSCRLCAIEKAITAKWPQLASILATMDVEEVAAALEAWVEKTRVDPERQADYRRHTTEKSRVAPSKPKRCGLGAYPNTSPEAEMRSNYPRDGREGETPER